MSTLRTSQGSQWWENLARVGYAASGLLHLVLGYLIVRIPARSSGGGGGGGNADQSAAIAQIRDAPAGALLLWVVVAGFAALGTWHIADGLRAGTEAKDRVRAWGQSVVYLAFAVTAAVVALGNSASGGNKQAQGFAGQVMSVPAGRVLVAAVGMGFLAVGLFHAWKGITKKFEDDLRPRAQTLPRPVWWLAVVGYVAKGAALATVGVLFIYAALTADPKKAEGIDGAISTLLDAPGGPVVVIAVGIGFAAYGAYSFLRARYARL